MRAVSTLLSYVLHPLLIPIAGTVAYFLITPKYSSLEVQSGNVLPIFILTVIIPIIVYFILRNLGLVTSIFLESVSERAYPLIIHLALLITIALKVIPSNYVAELYFYFVGLIAANCAALFLLLFRYKTSLHMMGAGSILMYLVALSIHFEINIVIAISLFTLACGLLATARLYLKAHSRTEVLVGFMLGFLCQLMTVKYWL